MDKQDLYLVCGARGWNKYYVEHYRRKGVAPPSIKNQTFTEEVFNKDGLSVTYIDGLAFGYEQVMTHKELIDLSEAFQAPLKRLAEETKQLMAMVSNG